MGGELYCTFPSKKIRDHVLGIIESHYDDIFALQPHVGPYRRPEFTGVGHKIEASYAIWFGGFGRLWMEAVLKWAAFRAGTHRTLGGVKGPWLDASSAGAYPIPMLDGQPDYMGMSDYYLLGVQFQLNPDDVLRFFQARIADPGNSQIFSQHFPEAVRPYREAIQTTLDHWDTLLSSGS